MTQFYMASIAKKITHIIIGCGYTFQVVQTRHNAMYGNWKTTHRQPRVLRIPMLLKSMLLRNAQNDLHAETMFITCEGRHFVYKLVSRKCS